MLWCAGNLPHTCSSAASIGDRWTPIFSMVYNALSCFFLVSLRYYHFDRMAADIPFTHRVVQYPRFINLQKSPCEMGSNNSSTTCRKYAWDLLWEEPSMGSLAIYGYPTVSNIPLSYCRH
jgi:hypothetical protein